MARRSGSREAGGSLPRETEGRVASSPDNDGTGQHCQMVRVRQARREGVREKPAAERSSRESTSSNLEDLGWAAARIRASAGELWAGSVIAREATRKACGVLVARLQGHSWSPNPTSGSRVNVGTIPAAPHRPACAGRREGPCRLMPPGWDGGRVVVAGATTGESRPQAKGSSRFAACTQCEEFAGEYRRRWPDLDEAEPQVLAMQTKLHQWAISDPDRRFDDLYNLVCDPAFLVVAWDRVRSNKGARSAGIDGMAPRSMSWAWEVPGGHSG